MKKALILDTSILCVWLQVPGKETCGTDNARWTYESVKQKIDLEIQNNSTLILPLATVIETGNHIAQANGDKHKIITTFVNHIENTLDGNIPWATFADQSHLIDKDALKRTLSTWKNTALANQSIGDALIVEVAMFYAKYGYEVEIFTGDMGLKAYQPVTPAVKPRRRN